MTNELTLKIIAIKRESLETIRYQPDGRNRLATAFKRKEPSIRFCGLKAFGE
jgi:hypothetical protein